MTMCAGGFTIPGGLVDDVSLSLFRRVQALEAEVDYLNSEALTKDAYLVDVNTCDDDGVYHVAQYEPFDINDFVNPRFRCDLDCDDEW
jgi:hypothetical protein